MKKLYLLSAALLCFSSAFGQKVQGYIYDAASKNQPLAGCSIYYVDKNGTKATVSDAEGFYELQLPEGGVVVTYSYLGYETQNFPLVVERRETLTRDVVMEPSVSVLDEVVVSVGRFEQKLSDVTVSMDVLKAADIARQNPSDIRSTLTTLPGVDINDKQPSIRGGSGWTYGVGSRALILVDGLSILTPGGGEIDWNSVPMENIEQVEVIKGASSVLYGSSALNGVINVRSARPGLQPQTRINAYMGVYGNPKEKSYIWWGRDFWNQNKYQVEPLLRKAAFFGVRNPMYNGVDFSHTRRIGNWDVSGSLNLFTDEGYKEGAFNKRIRVGGSVSHHNPNTPGLHYGLNLAFLSDDGGDQFIWRSPEEAYRQSPLTNMSRQSNKFYIDPFVNYYNSKNNTSHKIKGRAYFMSNNIVSNTTDKSIFQIANNMGFDYVESIPEIINLVKDPTPLIGELLPPLLTGDINKLANKIGEIGKEFFPTAKPADYMDLVSWIMGRLPLPTDQNSLVQWLLNPDQAKPDPVIYPDRTGSYYLDYQFSKKYKKATITAGATYEHVYAKSQVTGNHQSDNSALYFQYDDKFFDRLNLSLGVRFEYYRVDQNYREAETDIFGLKIPMKPVFRGGLNYQFGQASFLRASFGQGYRYPSITEKFVLKDIGGVSAYPNPNLKAESGWNAEIGFKQGYSFGPFSGYIDLAGFWTEYKDMIEFNIGLFDTEAPYTQINSLNQAVSMILSGNIPGIGAQFFNVDKARIYGVDFSISGICRINPISQITYNLGYVYIEPLDLNYKTRNAQEDAYTDPLQMKMKSNNSKYLKYRQKHSVKAVIDYQWKRLSIGTNLIWKSKTLAVDYFMVDERDKPQWDLMDYVRYLMFGDLKGYWEQMNKGHFTVDVRVGVQVTNNIRFQASIQNLFNKEYSMRPMDISAPRTFVFQANMNF